MTVERAMDILSLPNRRATAFIADSIVRGDPLDLYATAWREMLPWSEFRLVIRESRVVGVSQYHHRAVHPALRDRAEAVASSLSCFGRRLIDALHMQTVVADVFVEPQDDGSFVSWLIELNPFIQRTDPCLFTWRDGGDFDGTIRFLKETANPYRGTMDHRLQCIPFDPSPATSPA